MSNFNDEFGPNALFEDAAPVGGGQALLRDPVDITEAANGDRYILQANGRVRLLSGTTLSTLAGTMPFTVRDNTIYSTPLNIDSAGNLWTADFATGEVYSFTGTDLTTGVVVATEGGNAIRDLIITDDDTVYIMSTRRLKRVVGAAITEVMNSPGTYGAGVAAYDSTTDTIWLSGLGGRSRYNHGTSTDQGDIATTGAVGSDQISLTNFAAHNATIYDADTSTITPYSPVTATAGGTAINMATAKTSGATRKVRIIGGEICIVNSGAAAQVIECTTGAITGGWSIMAGVVGSAGDTDGPV